MNSYSSYFDYHGEGSDPRQMPYDGMSRSQAAYGAMAAEDQWYRASSNASNGEHRIPGTQLVGETPIGYNSFKTDPHRYSRALASEASGVWPGLLPPDVGPTLGRAGAYVPLYPKAFAPQYPKRENDWQTVMGAPAKSFDAPVGVDIGDTAREHDLPGFGMLMRNDEGHGYATGQLMVERDSQLTQYNRLQVYTPQRSAPIYFPEEAADAAKHNPTSDRPALLTI